jgi:histidinol-phosphatase (PHP family)
LKNYHTHTWRCKHATGDIEDYVEKALEAGGKVLGFSDHTPLPDGRVHWFPYHGSFHEMEDLRTGAHLKGYTDAVIKTMESGLFSFIAHPDLFGVAWKKWDEDSKACSRDILEAAVETGTPLEVNGYGFRKKKVITEDGQRPPYPWVPFWELASTYPIKVVYSSDAHNPGDVFANRDECLEIIDTCGLTLADLPF